MHKKANLKTRVIMTGCAVLLPASLLAACGGGTPAAKPADTKPNSTAAPAASGGAAAPAAPAAPLELTWMRYEHPSQAIINDSLALKEFQKRKNVKLTMQNVPQSNYDDKKKTLIATNTTPDVMLVKQDDIQNYADTGIFLDLTPYLDKMPNLKKVIEQQPDISKNKIDGKLYGFPLAASYAGSGGQLAMLRVDTVEKVGAKVPSTYDELYEVFKKIKAANPESYPFTARAANGLTGTENLLNPITFAFGSGYTTFNGSKVYYEPKEKKYKFGPNSPEFKDAVAWLNKLYKEKLLDPDYATATSQIWQEKLSANKAFYFQDNNGFANQFNIALQKSDPKAKFDLIPTLSAPNGTKRNLIYAKGHLSESYVLNAKVKNPEKVIEFMDWLYSDEGSNLTSFGLQGEHYTLTNGEYKMADALYNKYKDDKTPNYSLSSAFGLGYLGFAVLEDTRLGNTFATQQSLEWEKKSNEMEKAGESVRFVSDPPFTKEEREKLKQLRSQLDSYLTRNMDKFIMTDGALAKDWDGFVAELKKQGSDQLEKIYNDALARVK
ncbi:extracellular solute-binding protein [Paenibacillus thalictri]|uniref:Extracellular solute-binding protein n=1 Tax=Paenibacillus thalictri TaxID=2527873 RepID=A0A4V2J4Y6_9BACL|nr:extracellular solute-binding protein [Paenibacillus thalictri]TBL81722.1 extracellular solute-binding protein [Paenibacillus thalictri]